MRPSHGGSARRRSVFVVALAISGILMMHGFEASLVRTVPEANHASQVLEALIAVDHADACSPEIPFAAETKIREDCVVTLSAPTSLTIWRLVPGHEASNRDVLAALSILIV